MVELEAPAERYVLELAPGGRDVPTSLYKVRAVQK